MRILAVLFYGFAALCFLVAASMAYEKLGFAWPLVFFGAMGCLGIVATVMTAFNIKSPWVKESTGPTSVKRSHSVLMLLAAPVLWTLTHLTRGQGYDLLPKLLFFAGLMGLIIGVQTLLGYKAPWEKP